MSKETKTTLYITLLPLIWTIIGIILGYLVGRFNIIMVLLNQSNNFSLVVFTYLTLFSVPLLLSLILGEKIMEKSKVLSFILSPILAMVLSLVFYSVFLRSFLYSNWFLTPCCGPCDFGNGEVFLIMGILALGFFAAIASFISLFFIYSAHKSEQKI
ncbi:MAG: hypothetical protein Q8N88_05300 [Nanoarchaeota archaeon]|nr:hypothetical protein [Nanoarchaeota archaeon]